MIVYSHISWSLSRYKKKKPRKKAKINEKIKLINFSSLGKEEKRVKKKSQDNLKKKKQKLTNLYWVEKPIDLRLQTA